MVKGGMLAEADFMGILYGSVSKPWYLVMIVDHCYVSLRLFRYGSVSKPCTPGEHQNSW